MSRRWSAEEVKRMRDAYPTTSTAQLAREFGRGVLAVHQKACALNVKKSFFNADGTRRVEARDAP